MAVWSAIRMSALTADKRLDAEYYQPSNLKQMAILENSNLVRLGGIAYVTDGIHASPEIVECGGMQYLSAKCVKDNDFALGATLQISRSQHEANKRTSIKADDVLLTTVGTIGNAAVVQSDMLPANIDRHLGLIRLNADAPVDAYFLSTFLNSQYGRFQSFRESTGNVQLNLFIEKIKELRLPILSCSKKVSNATKKAYSKRVESAALYSSAEKLLLAELGLGDLDLSTTLFYERDYSEAQQVARLDAEFFQPQYQNVLKALKCTKPKRIVPLEEFLALLTNGHTPLHHDLSEGEVPFLTAEHVFDFRINFDSEKRILREHHEGELKRTRLKKGDCLITIKGRVGNAAIAEDFSEPVNINQDVALFRLKDGMPSYYLMAYLNSLAGQAFTRQYCTGQINPFLGLGNIRQLPVPVYDIRRMERIAEKTEEIVLQARAARDESHSLIEEAKRMVEDAILN